MPGNSVAQVWVMGMTMDKQLAVELFMDVPSSKVRLHRYRCEQACEASPKGRRGEDGWVADQADPDPQ